MHPLIRSALLAGILAWTPGLPGAGAADLAPLAGERVLWLGDSITQAGDYVSSTSYYLERMFPRQAFDIVSIGRSSETLSGLSERNHPGRRPCVFDRLARALELVKPAAVVACYGMNDGIYHPASPERQRAFEDGVRKLINLGRGAGAKVILLTPPPFDRLPVGTLRPRGAPDYGYQAPYEGYDDVLGDFARWELALPKAAAQVIDLHGPINAYLAVRRRTSSSYTFVKDGIHPNAAGHLLMAQCVLRGLGVALPPEAADLDTELARIEADPLFALIKHQREARSAAWLAYVGLPGAIDRAEEEFGRAQKQIDEVRAR